MVGSFPGCCARAESGHAAAELAITLMKSRGLIASSEAQDHAFYNGIIPNFDRAVCEKWRTTDRPFLRRRNVRLGSKADMAAKS
jgi:hypothetical protein